MTVEEVAEEEEGQVSVGEVVGEEVVFVDPSPLTPSISTRQACTLRTLSVSFVLVEHTPLHTSGCAASPASTSCSGSTATVLVVDGRLCTPSLRRSFVGSADAKALPNVLTWLPRVVAAARGRFCVGGMRLNFLSGKCKRWKKSCTGRLPK